MGTMYHNHMYAEMLFCAQGSLIIHTEEQEFTIGEGEMVLIPRTVRHYSKTAFPGTVVKVYGMVAERCDCRNAADVFGLLSPIFSGSVVRVFPKSYLSPELLDQCKEKPDDPSNCFIVSRFLEGLQAGSKVDCHAPMPTGNELLPEREIKRLVYLRELINSEYYTDLSLHRVASELYLSEQYAARIIRKHYGTSLTKLVFAKRMEAAAKLLMTTDDSADVISQKVGFRSKSGFYRQFRAHFGVTPAMYRRLAREQSTEKERV
ncbi:MAG: helix-turn-helix domain-containing protein [Clostridia bacterium]|nr:helix-turn-helix domain-containing protein [Clostridia bacterium]